MGDAIGAASKANLKNISTILSVATVSYGAAAASRDRQESGV